MYPLVVDPLFGLTVNDVIVGGGIAKPASLPMPKYCVPAVRLVGENVPPATV